LAVNDPYASSLPRLQTPALPPVQPFNPAAPVLQAQGIEQGQTQLQMLNRQNQTQDITFRNGLIANAAAHALDSESWDAAMQQAVKQGAPEAAQFVGRYTPLLQQRLFQAYAGAPQGTTAGSTAAGANAAPATPTDMLDRMYQNVPPAQMAQSLAKNNMILGVLSTVKDEQSWNAAAARLTQAGIPNAAAIMGPYNPLRVVQLWNETQARVNYLQSRVAGAATGEPAPLVKNDVQNVGDVAYSVNPYAGTATAMTPPKPEKIGVDPYGMDVYGVRDANAPGGFRKIDTSALPTGSGVDIATAASRIQGIENATGNPAATAPINPQTGKPASSAVGNGQFTEQTWLDTFKKTQPDLAKTMTDQQILALRTNPQFSAQMTQVLATDNAAALAKANLPVTTASLALAHRFGAGDATKILNAPPNEPLENILSKKVLDANPELRGQTAGAYTQGLVKQVGNDPVNTGQAAGESANIDLHGEDYLKTLPAQKAGIVRAVVEGRAPFPSGFIMKTPYGQWLSQAVTQAEPGFNAANWNMRNQVYKEWNAGGPNSPASILTAGNTAIQHLGKLSDAAEKLENWSGWGVFSKPLNALTSIERQYAQDPRVSTFDSIRNKYIEEATKFYRGTGGNEADLQRDIAALNAAQSPEQLHQAIATQAELMQSKINALQDRWIHANTLYDGRVIAPPFPIVEKESQSALDKIKAREGATGSVPVAAPAPVAAAAPAPPAAILTPPIPGAKLFKGQWYTRGPNGEAVPVAVH
jgi:hypothetical protein